MLDSTPVPRVPFFQDRSLTTLDRAAGRHFPHDLGIAELTHRSIVEYATKDQARTAVDTLSNQNLMGRLIYVREVSAAVNMEPSVARIDTIPRIEKQSHVLVPAEAVAVVVAVAMAAAAAAWVVAVRSTSPM